jgi:Protein phosphatase 2C
MAERWNLLVGSAKGTSHDRSGGPCQDFAQCRQFTVDTTPILIAVCADGAGTAARSEVGARLACTTLLDIAARTIEDGLAVRDVTSRHVRAWYEVARGRLSLQACLENLELRDFACTLLAAVLSPEAAIFSQIGDGAIVIGVDCRYRVVFWPQSGEFANTTYFLSGSDFSERLEFVSLGEPINDMAIMTDGLQNLALHLASRSVHGPFFEPMFESLRNSACTTDLEQPLVAFLNSAAVNERTDDDKTLILATRRYVSNAST